jgi:hypothetical protein
VRIGAQCYPTHYLQDLLGRLEGIDEFQLEQQPGHRLLIRLVVPDSEQRAAISGRLAQWWSGQIELEFTDLADLKRSGWRSKFRHLVGQPQRAIADNNSNVRPPAVA